MHRELEESRADAAARADEALRTGAALEESRRALEAAERAHAAAGDAWAEERPPPPALVLSGHAASLTPY